MDAGLLWNFFLAMIAIVNPLGKIPVWVEASQGCDQRVRFHLATLVTATATLLLLVFLLFGRELLEFLGLDVPSFRVGGGIIILLVGIDMLRGTAVDIEKRSGEDEEGPVGQAKARFRDVVVPVAVPILAGPGSMTTALLFGFRADDWADRGFLAAIMVLVMGVVFVILLLGPRIEAILGDLVLNVQTRIWGLLLTAIAAQMILVGLGETFPSWLEPNSPIVDDVQSSADASEQKE